MKKRMLILFVAMVMLVIAMPMRAFAWAETAEPETEITDEIFFKKDIWNSDTQTFNADVVDLMIKFLSMSSDGEDVSLSEYPIETLNTRATITTNHSEILNYLGFEENFGQHFFLTVGGLRWYPTYLSTDKNGDTVLTLWLTENQQNAWSGYVDGYKVETDSSGVFYDGGYYSSYGVGDNYMYGTSMVRSYGLNNAADYVYTGQDGYGEAQYSSYSPNANHPFALFTMDSLGFTQYLTTPSQMTWQEYQAVDIWERYADGTGSSLNEYLNLISSQVASDRTIYTDEAYVLGNYEFIKETVGTLLQMLAGFMMSSTNDAWTTDIVNETNQEEIIELIDLYKNALIAEVQQNSTGDTEADGVAISEIEVMVEGLKLTYLPYVAVDKYGNYYNFYNSGCLNYQTEEHYSDWKDDYLWLPSASECGPRSAGFNGIWGLTTPLIKNGDSKNIVDADGTTILSSNDIVVRSAGIMGPVIYYYDATNYNMGSNTDLYAMRPAFHLNLTKVIENLESDDEMYTKRQYVYVDEIWDSENKTFNLDNLSKLYYYITGDKYADLNTMQSLLSNSSTGTYSSAAMRAVTIDGEKNNTQDIVVRIGGYDWYVTYLSNNKDGTPVLTLWMKNSVQKGLAYNKKFFYNSAIGNYNGGLAVLTGTQGVYGNDPMSYLGLNGTRKVYVGQDSDGIMKWEVDAEGYTTFTPSNTHPFALYTVEEMGFTQYLTTPRQMAWQEFQSFSEYNSLANEAWSDEVETKGDNFLLSANFAGFENNSAWADDYLWIPSYTEILPVDWNYDVVGLWDLSSEQLINYDGFTTSTYFMGMSMQVATVFRSAIQSGYTSEYCYMVVDTTGSVVGNTTDARIGYVRPAMHLDLSSLPSYSAEGLKLNNQSSIYNGEDKVQDIEFTYNERVLNSTTDYTIEIYKDSVQVYEMIEIGTYIIVFKGQGSLAELYPNEEFVYKVNTIDLSSTARVEILEIPEYIDGVTNSIEPEILVTLEGVTLVENEHYTITYSNNTVPTAKAQVTVRFIGNYSGIISKTFIISGISLQDAVVILEGDDDLYETDLVTMHKYGVEAVYFEGIKLVENVDYIWYYLNLNDLDAKEQTLPNEKFIYPGFITIVVEGIGNYKSATYSQYEIKGIDISKVNIVYDNTDLIYDGTEQKKGVTITHGGYTLVEDVDYAVNYTNNINASSQASMWIQLLGNYSGRTEILYYTINRRNINTATLDEGAKNLIFTNSAYSILKDIGVSLEYNGVELSSLTDYVYDPTYVVDAGTYTITFTGKNNWTGTRSVEVVIQEAPIVDFEVKYMGKDWCYYGQCDLEGTGTNYITYFPYIELPNGEKYNFVGSRLGPNSQYVKVYRNGIPSDDFTSVGEITLEISGYSDKNIYMEEGQVITKTFTIRPAPITSVEWGKAYWYNGLSQTIAFRVETDYSTLVRLEDYSIEYYNKTTGEKVDSIVDAGDYNFEITLVNSNYTCEDSSKLVGTFYIVSLGIDSNDINYQYFYIDDQGNYTDEFGNLTDAKVIVDINGNSYTGLPLGVEISYRGSVLEEGVDYNISKDSSKLESDGVYTITIEGLGNFSSTNIVEFIIKKYRLQDMAIKHFTLSKTYDFGNPIEVSLEEVSLYNSQKKEYLTASVDFDYYEGEFLVNGQMVSINKFRNNINVGTAYMYLQGKGDYVGVIAVSFVINPIDISSEKCSQYFSIPQNEYEYIMSEIKPVVSHTYAELGKDFIVTYSNNFSVGTAVIQIEGRYPELRDANYQGTFKMYFEIINKNIADLDITTIETMPIEIGYSGKNETITNLINRLKYSTSEGSQYLESDTHYSVVYYRSGEATSDLVSLGTITIELTGVENKGFYGTKIYNVTIARMDIADTAIIRENYETLYNYNQGNKVFDGSLYHYGTELVEGEDYTIVFYRDDVETQDIGNEGTVKAVVQGINNYSGSFEHTFVIEKWLITGSYIIKENYNPKYKYYLGNKVFNGTLRHQEVDLIEGQDYIIVFYRDDVETQDIGNEGTVKAVIQGINNYSGSFEHTFVIEKSVISRFTNNKYENVYNKQKQLPTPLNVYDNQSEMLASNEYILIYYIFDEDKQEYVKTANPDFITPNKYKIVAEVNPSRNNYKGSCEAIYEILPKPIDDLLTLQEIEDLFEDKEFTNSDIKQEIDITFGDYGLVEGEDYEIHYDNNKDTGSVTVTITGLGHYSGSFNTSFEILSKPMDTIETNMGENISDLVIFKEYTGENISLIDEDFDELIPFGVGFLVAGEDFTYEYEDADRIELGEYSIILRGKGNYSSNVRITMKIVPIDFSTSLTISEIYDQVYTGKTIVPTFTFQIKGVETTLRLETDYSIEYSDNINVGTATIAITGKGIYGGVYETSFNIIPKDISVGNILDIDYQDKHVYSGSVIDEKLIITDTIFESTALVMGTDFDKVVYTDTNKNGQYEVDVDTVLNGGIINSGEYIIHIIAKGNYSGDIYLPLVVDKIQVSDALSTGLIIINGVQSSYEYNSSAIKPTIAIMFDSINITNTDFNITYGNNITVATGGDIIIIAKEESNYTGTYAIHFDITKAIINVVIELKYSNSEFVAGSSLPELVVVSSENVEGTLSYLDANDTLREGENYYNWIFTPIDTDNYEIVNGKILISVPKETSLILLWVVIAGVLVIGTFVVIILTKLKKKGEVKGSYNNELHMHKSNIQDAKNQEAQFDDEGSTGGVKFIKQDQDSNNKNKE